MKEEDWKRFGEIQYLRGRLDELFKLNNELSDIGLNGLRLLDARITKYLDKLKECDELSYHLYHIEKENIKYKIKKIKDKKDSNG